MKIFTVTHLITLALTVVFMTCSSLSFAEEAVPSVATPKTTAAEPVTTGYGKTDRPLGDFLVGPFATIVALPRPFSFGIEAKYLDLVGLEASYGVFPEVTFQEVKAKMKGWDVRAKWYPMQGAFFVGLGFGTQTTTGASTKTISGINASATLVQDNTFIAPHVGWNWIWESGLFMGIDLGVQLSLGHTNHYSTNVTNTTVLNSAEYASLQKAVNDEADKLGKQPLPLLSLLKIGYLF